MTKVLYIDDVRSILTVGKILMEREGLEVSTAISPSEALEIMEKEKFDAVISDYAMPKMNGVEFLKKIRERGDNTPFILFTGKGESEVVVEAFHSGLDFYLPKAGNPKDQYKGLSHLVEQIIKRREPIDDGL